MVCAKRRGRPGEESLLWVTVLREVSGGETEASRPSCGLDQHCAGGDYRGDPGLEGRSLCEPGHRHGARRTPQKEAFPKVGQNMLSSQELWQWLCAPVRGWPQIWIWANLPDFHNLDRNAA